MKITDAIALAKAGYKKADIEEMLSSKDNADQPDQVPDQTLDPGESTVDDITTDDLEDDKSREEQDIDYKKMYEETQKELENMRDQIKKLQEDNRHRNNDDKTQNDTDARLYDIFRAYM